MGYGVDSLLPSANPVIGNGAIDQESVNDSFALEGEETILETCESEKGESVSCGPKRVWKPRARHQ